MGFRLCIASLLLAVASFPAAASAGDWYLATDAGLSHYADWDGQLRQPGNPIADIGFFLHTTGQTSSADSTGYRLAGGYQVTPVFGLEAGYLDLGHASVTINGHTDTTAPDCQGGCINLRETDHETFGATGITLAGTFTASIADDWSLSAHLGLLRSQATLDYRQTVLFPDGTSDGGLSESRHATATSLSFGGGVAYALTPAWSLRLGLDVYHRVGDDSTTTGSVRLISAGVIYRFR